MFNIKNRLLRHLSMRFSLGVLVLLFLAACSSDTNQLTTTTDISKGEVEIDYSAGLTINYAAGMSSLRTQNTEILANSGFNTNSDWYNCGPTTSSNIANGKLTLSNGGCVYQTVAAIANKSYTLVCDSASSADYSSVTLSMLDANWNPIDSTAVIVNDNSAQPSVVTNLSSTANTSYVAVTIYSEGPATHESCSLTTGTTPTTPVAPVTPVDDSELLLNSGFNTNSDWYNCGNDASSNISNGALTLSNGGCVYQTIAATANESYTLVCDSASSADYSSVTLSMLDASWSPVDSTAVIVNDTSAQPSVIANLNSTNNTSYVAVTIYSEGPAIHESCSLKLGSTTVAPPTSGNPPSTGNVATTVHPVPLPNGSLYPYANQYPNDNESAQAANNILVNPTFADQTGWQNCATSSATISGGQLNTTPGVCFYQNVAAVPGTTYTLTCKGEMSLPTYSVFMLNMLDSSNQTLASETQTLHTSSRQWRIQLQAPANTSTVSISFYTENDASYDYCYLTPLSAPALAGEEVYAPVKDMEVIVPIYIDPAQDIVPWNHVIATAQTVPTTVVVNPVDNNIAACQQDIFATTLDRLQQASVDTVGYVATGYTDVAINTVKANIDLLAQCNGMDGVFFDEIRVSTADEANYYQQVCSYAKSVFGNSGKFVLNAGTNIELPMTNEFCNIALIYEFYESNWDDFAVFGYEGAWTDPATSVIIHTGNTDMVKAIDLAYSRKIDYIYMTDATVPNPWTRISNYWYTFMDYIAQKNAAF